MHGGSISLPHMPRYMDQIQIGGSNSSSPVSLHIDALPDSLDQLTLYQIDEFSWNESGYVEVFDLLFDPTQPVEAIFPQVAAGSFRITYGRLIDLDLSMVQTEHVTLFGSTLYGPVGWPPDVRFLLATDIHFEPASGPLILPDSLRELNISSSSQYCIHWLPNSLERMEFLGQGIGCLPNWPTSLLPANCLDCPSDPTDPMGNVIYCSVLNSNCPGAFPGISGNIFIDIDQDGQLDPEEPPLQLVSVQLQPNGNTTGANTEGYWELGVIPGEYLITPSSGYPYLQSITPESHSASVPNMGDSDTDNNFAATLTPGIQDLRIELYADPARPGFDNRLYLSCQNYGTIPVDADVTLNFDADQSWVGSSLAPDAQSGTTATWSLSAMAIGETRHFTVDLNTAASVALGTDISHTITANPVATDETPLDNVSVYNDSVVGSYDPNDKTASPNVLTSVEVALGNTPIEYTIRFQNTGTYLAERVVILDTLSEDLQWESMRFIASSHPNHWYVTDGVLHVIHNDIMLPDSTSDEAGSHGFIKFNMLPATDLQDGATISNIAHIVFDFNEPIITPPAVFSVDVEAGVLAHATEQMRVYPNPATDLLRVELPLGNFQGMNYVVRDVLGQEVMSGRLGGSKQVKISDLEDGSYTIEMIGAETRSVARFVKQ